MRSDYIANKELINAFDQSGQPKAAASFFPFFLKRIALDGICIEMKLIPVLWLTVCACLPAQQAAPTTSVLTSPAIVLCLRPIRLARSPGLAEAVESVKRLSAFAKSQEGESRKAAEALIYIIKDLFQKEQDLVTQKKIQAEAEKVAQAKEKHAAHTEMVGSPLTGKNPRLAALIRQEAADLRAKANFKMDEAFRVMREKLTAYNISVAYFQRQGEIEVVICLANALFAIVDRHLPEFDFKSTVTREWVQQQKLLLP